MPDNVAAALAVLITAMATALLQYSTSHWGKRNDDDRRRIDAPYDHEDHRHHGDRRQWDDPDYDGPERRHGRGHPHSNTHDGWDDHATE